MTLKEAKKILEKEGYDVEKVGRPSSPSIVFTAYESPEICEAMQVVCSAGYGISMVSSCFDDRKARLSLELAENSAPMPGPGEEQPKEGNPALEEAASQFNDTLLDEQSKKIKRLGKEITRLNKIIHKKNLKIEELKKKRSEHLAGEVKLFGETVDLSQELCDKNEEIRLSKIREKNLTEVCQKYMKENEELKKELADKVVDKIDAQALKSAESALAWKEKVVTYKDMALAYYEKKITEKDEVIDDLGKELEATKNELEEKNYLIDMLRNSSREYCEYGIAAEKMIQKMAKVIVGKSAISSEDFKNYRHWANGYRFSPLLPEFCDEEQMNLQEEALKKCNTSEDNHPTEDNSEEVEMEEILEHVREVLEKGGTVTTSYDKAEEGGDKSATIVQHGNSIANLFKEIKRLWQ